MPIKYYPDRTQKRVAFPVDIIQKGQKTYFAEGGGDIGDGGINAIIWPKFPAWAVKQVNLHFDSESEKSYSIAKLCGRGIIAGLNDKLWFGTVGAPTQAITLSPGFYDNGSNPLADELKAQLDANEAFDELGLTPFTVEFNESTGLFSISTRSGSESSSSSETGSSGLIKFISRNEAKPAFHKDSTGGEVFGFTADSEMASTIVSDTVSASFGQTFAIVSADDSTAKDVSLTDEISMSVDDALLVSASSSDDIWAAYLVAYKEI